jgi:hypothetical protein
VVCPVKPDRSCSKAFTEDSQREVVFVEHEEDSPVTLGPDGGTERFLTMLQRGSLELYEHKRDKMTRGDLLETLDLVAPADVALFFERVESGLIEFERGAK